MMRLAVILAVLAAVTGATGCRMNARIQDLEEKVARLETGSPGISEGIVFTRAEIADLIVRWQRGEWNAWGILIERYADSLECPPVSDREALKRYLEELSFITNANLDDRMREVVDRKIRMVGVENIDLLTPYLNNGLFASVFGEMADIDCLREVMRQGAQIRWLVPVFNRKATSEDIDYILANLESFPELIHAADRLDIADRILPAAREAVLKDLRRNRGRLGNSRACFDYLLRELEPADAEAFKVACWEIVRRAPAEPNQPIPEVAWMLARNGFVPAYRFLGDHLDSQNSYGQNLENEMGRITERIDGPIRDWFRENRDRIYFNRDLGLYCAE